ncbi:MAG TPA: hypothetical protein V6D14_14720 [Coleofasciculaceae cyanobacterium]
MNVKHTLEFLICFFSRHDFIVSPENNQHLECRRCHQPYAATLREKSQLWSQKSVEIPSETLPSKAVETVGAKK